MKSTRICDLLRIQYPIIQGGMLWLATADLAAAVSNAGSSHRAVGPMGRKLGPDVYLPQHPGRLIETDLAPFKDT